MIFKNHRGKVKSISWFDDDLGFVSTGLDAMIYIWDLKNSNNPEYQFKQQKAQINFDCIEKVSHISDQGGKNEPKVRVFACGTDKTL